METRCSCCRAPASRAGPSEEEWMGTIAPLTIEIETKSPRQVIDITGHVGGVLDGAPGR